MKSERLFFVDTTMRDGTQAPGIHLDSGYKRNLVHRLSDAGITEIEAGIPAMGEEEQAFLRSLRNRPERIIAWCRARSSDLADSESAGTGAVHIGFPISERLLETMNWSRMDLLRRIPEFVRSGLSGHDFVSVGFMDCFRADSDLLTAAVETALEAGAGRARLADSVGVGTPERVRALAALFHLSVRRRLEFHAHNDLGMATANAFQALESGFGGVSGTIGGIGERAGNLCWEQLAVGMATLGLEVSGMTPRVLVRLAEELHERIGEPIPPRRPVIGEACRIHESGIHAAAHIKDPLSFLPYRPQDHGLPPARLVAGTTSGRKGLAGMLRSEGIEPDAAQIERLVYEVRKRAGETDRCIAGEELARLYERQIEVPI